MLWQSSKNLSQCKDDYPTHVVIGPFQLLERNGILPSKVNVSFPPSSNSNLFPFVNGQMQPNGTDFECMKICHNHVKKHGMEGFSQISPASKATLSCGKEECKVLQTKKSNLLCDSINALIGSPIPDVTVCAVANHHKVGNISKNAR